MKHCILALSVAALLPRLALAQSTAEELLARMSLEERAGQLLVSWILSKEEGQAANREKLRAAIRDAGLGGVILSIGPVADAAGLVADLQAVSKVPLLVAADFEGGVAFRMPGATEMGNQMLVGATGLDRMAYAMGRVTGSEAMALGIPWCFAPVLDVNSNPDNPIINVRSFGEDPALVARLGTALAAGIRSAGAIPCGKHFPGHGDVNTDSHLALATVPGDAARLRSVELLPFRVASAAGLESVMSGHLAVPGLGEDPAVPATLSRRILTDELRGNLGFNGLVVTDALDMGGVKNAFPADEVAIRALLAGADVLLMPPDPVAVRAAVVAAVQSGRVPQARLDEAVLRILRTKEKLGLLAGRATGPAANWREVVASPAHQQVGEEIAQRGMTLVFDREGLVPLPRAADPWLVVSLQDQPGLESAATSGDLAKALMAAGHGVEELRLHGGSTKEQVQQVAERVAAARRILLALHVRVRSYSGTIGLPPALAPVVQALQPAQQVVGVSFGSPYLARAVPHLDAYLCAFASAARMEGSVARVLLGTQAVHGRMPVRIPDVAPAGAGLARYPGTDLPEAKPGDEGFASDLAGRIEQLLAGAVRDGTFPGATCIVARHGKVVARVAVGHDAWGEGAKPVSMASRYDLASLTKVSATLPAVLCLLADGTIQLDDPVEKWVPGFRGASKDKVTLRHLLTHSGGLPAYERYYRTMSGRRPILGAAAAEALMGAPGEATTYSDLGFVLLMAVVEQASAMPFEQFVQQRVFDVLGMKGATFAPTHLAQLADAVPTEEDPVRGGIVRGHVHDENAHAMGGISGHAGLFGTADDVLRVGLSFLGGGRGMLPPQLADAAREPVALGGGRRALGFELPGAGSWGGTTVPAGLFGHTGFTGTSLWCDPASDTCVVLLTNRVHPTRSKGGHTKVRTSLHDVVQAAMER